MPLKTQIILVATLFITFAALSVVARMRNASLRRRRRRRKRRIPSADDAESAVPAPSLQVPEHSAEATSWASPSVIIILVAILLASGAAVAVLLFG